MDLSPELMTEFVVVDTHDYMYELIGRLPRKRASYFRISLTRI